MTLTTRLASGNGIHVVTVANRLPYVAVYLTPIHNQQFSIPPLSKSEFLSTQIKIKYISFQLNIKKFAFNAKTPFFIEFVDVG